MTLVNREETYSHNDPNSAFPENEFVDNLVTFLRTVKRLRPTNWGGGAIPSRRPGGAERSSAPVVAALAPPRYARPEFRRSRSDGHQDPNPGPRPCPHERPRRSPSSSPSPS